MISDHNNSISRLPRLVGGGFENKVYMILETNLAVDKAREILENPDESKVMLTPPLKPRGGEVFVFSHGVYIDKANDWKADKFIWMNKGGQGIPRNFKSFWKRTIYISQHANDPKGGTTDL